MESGTDMLLKPIQIGSLLLKNRMVRSPMWSRTSGVSGEVTDQMLAMYESAARGGPSMIIIEATAVAWQYAWPESQLRIDDVRFMPGLRRLVETIHLNGSACEFQLHCAGAFSKDPISPSGVACYGLGRAWHVQPRILSLEEAEGIRDQFIAASVRAKELDCEGIVLHGATSYLLQQWVSPRTNKRMDRYGGSFENRIQLPLEIVRGIRKKCGPSFLIGYSMVIDELLPDGITLDESTGFAKALEQEGVDHIDLMSGTYETGSLEKGVGRSPRQPKGLFDKAEHFKKSIDMKVFSRCMGEHDPIRWEEGLKEGQCDVIMIGRPLLCDPDLPNKLRSGKTGDIRFCIRCAQCYETGVIKAYQCQCALNPSLGKEREYEIRTIGGARKKVLVIGGGPAGLEAARVTALRGHEVRLVEKKAELGGYARIAAIPTGKEDIKISFLNWIERECRKAGVKIDLNTEGSIELIKNLKPDAAILAVGAIPLIPEIPGIDNPQVVLAEEVLSRLVTLGKTTVVAGGGVVGVETAEFIIENGLSKEVVIIEMLPSLATDMPAMPRTYMLAVVLPASGIMAYTGMKITKIEQNEIITLDKDWKEHVFRADSVVNAMGYVPNTEISEQLSGEVSEVYMIGDCVKPRNILSAVHEGAHVARQI